MSAPAPSALPRHRWTFHRFGGVDQVVFREAADLLHLPELDLKLWMALSMPTQGILFDPRTTALIDTDGNGRIHPEELLAAVRWTCDALSDPGLLLQPQAAVRLADIRDPALAASARHVLANLGRGDAEAIALADVTDRARIFAQTLFNGDGVVPPEAAGEDRATETLLRDIVGTLEGVMDRSGRLGVDTALLTRFFADATAFLAWAGRSADPAVSPLGPEATARAVQALDPLEAKIDDYFARCRLAAFDDRALGSLNRDPAEYASLALQTLAPAVPEAAAFPLARIAPDRPLPLREGLNPAWIEAVRTLAAQTVEPLRGADRETLDESAWREIKARLAPHRAHAAARPASPVAALGEPRLRELLAGDLQDRAGRLIARDLAVAPESESIAAVEKLARYCRDLPELLTNYVNFADFYGHTDAVFQLGTLYLDGRACTLCVEVADEARHTTLAGLSGFFLAYCDLQRPGVPKRRIVAAITDGDSDNLMVGRNGLFLDRQGTAWDATVTRIVSAPISVRQAFWLPYKKFVRMIEEQIAKRAQAADDTATTRLTSGVEAALNADPARKPAARPADSPVKPLELGTIALIGTAIGGISALVGGFLKALFGLGFWLPLGLLGILLLISGPSMLLASLKLRRRNLAPLLDANGWAINTRARVNIPFGAYLTRLAVLPPGTIPSLQDPFADKRRPWFVWICGIAFVLVLGAWLLGALDRHLPTRLQRHRAAPVSAVSAPSEPAASTPAAPAPPASPQP